MQCWSFPALASIVCVTTSCVYTQGTLVNPSATQYAPVPEELVQILTVESALDTLNYVRVAIIEATGSGEFTSQTGMLDAMRKKAGEMGANAILLPQIQEPGAGAKVAGAVLGVGTQRKGNVIALRILGRKLEAGRPAGPPAPGDAMPAQMNQALPQTVNDSLQLDWRAFVGAQLRTETEAEGANDFRYSWFTEYAATKTPDGTPALERRQAKSVWATQGNGTPYRDRVVISLEGAKGIKAYYLRTQGAAYELEIAEGTIVFDSAGQHRAGTVPRGTLPSTLLSTAIAALPDSLPTTGYIWFLERDSWPTKVSPTRVEFGERSMVTLPIAQAGTACSPDGKGERTEKREVEVVAMTVTVGAAQVGWPILRKRPHLIVRDAKCVRLPS